MLARLSFGRDLLSEPALAGGMVSVPVCCVSAGAVAPPPAAGPQAVPPGDQTGPQCREYQSTAIIGGKEEKVYGRACRQPDGTWKNVGALSPTPTPGAGPAEGSGV